MEVNQFLKQFGQMRDMMRDKGKMMKMMKQMGGMPGMEGLSGMAGKMPQMPSFGSGGGKKPPGGGFKLRRK